MEEEKRGLTHFLPRLLFQFLSKAFPSLAPPYPRICPPLPPPSPPPRAASFPKVFDETVRTIVKRLFRVYAHIYHSHLQKVASLGEEAHLNTCFKVGGEGGGRGSGARHAG